MAQVGKEISDVLYRYPFNSDRVLWTSLSRLAEVSQSLWRVRRTGKRQSSLNGTDDSRHTKTHRTSFSIFLLGCPSISEKSHQNTTGSLTQLSIASPLSCRESDLKSMEEKTQILVQYHSLYIKANRANWKSWAEIGFLTQDISVGLFR